MKATVPKPRGAAMDETIAYEPDSNSHAEEVRGRFVFASGARPLEGYTIKRAVGRGGFGEVYYAISDAGKEVALKLITRNLEVERRGVQQCMNLKSPHLIGIHDLRTNDEGDTFVIMEFVSGPSLSLILDRHPGGLPHDEVRHWLRGLVSGVGYLHDHGVVHRDLKPANLFLEEGIVKIGDYGLSKAITSGREPGHSQSVGTCHYMAPEIGTGKYHKPIDIYAIGVIVFEMLTGRVPFEGESVQEVLMKHLTSRPDLSPLPEPYRSLVARAMAKDPNQRPARVTDLLLPGDAPREPSVRFIGDDRTAAAGTMPDPSGTDPDVLQIGPEEPVLYIGPETSPRRRGRCRPGRLVGRLWNACPIRSALREHRKARAFQAPTSRRGPVPASHQEPPAPATMAGPSTLPSGRVRLAELSSSMLLTAPLAALATLLCVPVFGMLDADPPERIDQLVLFFATALVGTWGVLVPAKFWEGRETTILGRRLTLMFSGLTVGLVAACLTAYYHLGFPPESFDNEASEKFLEHVSQDFGAGFTSFAMVAAYFTIAYGVIGFGRLADRGRKARFQFMPVILAAILASILAAFIPSPEPWAALILVCVAVLSQLASPWSPEAATQSRYRRTRRGHRGR